MCLVLDGCRYTRTEKVAAISGYPQAIKSLNVCWESASGTNCGRCEKCLRTQLNFLAVGVAEPACFPGPLDLRRVRTMRLRSHIHFRELTSLRSYARQHGRSGRWMRALNNRIMRYRLWHRWENLARRTIKNFRWWRRRR